MKQVSAKQAFKKFKPYAFVFVLSVDKQGKPSGMIAAWQTKCSHKPPLFAVCLAKKGYTQKLIRQSKEFVVAVPNKQLIDEVMVFGTKSGKDIDKFTESKVNIKKSKHIKTPLLKDATINFECKLKKEIILGDHIMFIGRVLTSYLNENKKVLLSMDKINNKWIFKEF